MEKNGDATTSTGSLVLAAVVAVLDGVYPDDCVRVKDPNICRFVYKNLSKTDLNRHRADLESKALRVEPQTFAAALRKLKFMLRSACS